MRNATIKLLCSSTIALFTSTTAAYADEQTAKDNNPGQLDEIVVTAERRSSTVQGTALSIQAFKGSDLAAARVESITDLQLSVPGLIVGRVGLSGVVVMRGVGTDIVTIGSDSSVATYIDGSYRARPRDALGDFLDVARIEVLKGPQGTLYGRNSVGGAINVVTNDPQNKLSALAQASYGNFEALQLGAMVNIPVIDDKVLVRAVVQYDRDDGFVENLFKAPNVAARLNTKDLLQSRVKLTLKPTDGLTINLGAEYSRDKSQNAAYKPEDRAPNLARDVFGGRVSPDTYQVYQDSTAPVDGETWGLTGKINIAPDVIAEGVEVTSLTSYFSSKATEVTDRDGTDLLFAPIAAPDQSRAFYQEVQVNYESERFKAVFGGTYFHEDVDQLGLVVSSIPSFGPGVPPSFGNVRVNFDTKFKNNAYGVYMQGTYSLTEKIKVTGGIRFSKEDKRFDSTFVTRLPFGPPAPVSSDRAGKDSWSSWTPLIRAEYSLSRDAFVYALASKGFKSGAFNTASPNPGPSIAPETAWSYEAGLKSTLFNNRLRFNLAAFLTNFDNLQVQIFKAGEAVVGVQNASKARIKGLELETALAITDFLKIDLSGTYLDTQYIGYKTDDVLRCGFGAPAGCNPTVDLSGNQLARAPKWTGNAGLQFDQSTSFGKIAFRGDLSYRSVHYFSAFNRPSDKQNGYAVANANINWSANDGRLSLSLFVRNITNKSYRLNQGAPNSVVPAGNYWSRPRTYGATVSYRFGD